MHGKLGQSAQGGPVGGLAGTEETLTAGLVINPYSQSLPHIALILRYLKPSTPAGPCIDNLPIRLSSSVNPVFLDTSIPHSTTHSLLE
jgi:hypothetical protein